MTSKEMLTAAKYETRPNKYAFVCDVCGAARGVGAARIVRPIGGGNGWVPLCCRLDCTRTYLASESVGQWDCESAS